MTTAQAVTPIAAEERILLNDVSWNFYCTFSAEFRERPVRLSYSEGMLEIMITHRPHEYYKKVLAKLVEAIVLERRIPVCSGGSMTFQRDDLCKGFEPDECWWIAHEPDIRGKAELNFPGDPPPDLAIEIEMTHSLLDRIAIYAATGVPEIWRWNGKELRFCALGAEGQYADVPTSLSFPFLRPEDLLPYLSITDKTDETTRILRFVEWLRNLPPAPPAT